MVDLDVGRAPGGRHRPWRPARGGRCSPFDGAKGRRVAPGCHPTGPSRLPTERSSGWRSVGAFNAGAGRFLARAEGPPRWGGARRLLPVRPSRLPAPAVAVVVLGVVVAAWFGLRGPSSQPAHPQPGPAAAPGWGVLPAGESDERVIRLHGRRETPGPSEPRGPDPASSGRRSSPPPDPWGPGGESPASPSSESEPDRFGPFPSAGVSPDGEVVFGQATGTTTTVPEGHQLVCYLIGALAPAASDLAPVLQGLADETTELQFGQATWWAAPDPPAGPDPWWTHLAEALVDAVGRDRWPALDTVLAWDSKQAALYVQQDAEGHSRVTELLSRRAAGRLGVIQLSIELEGKPTEHRERLVVDVPWGESVRAHRGSAWAYIADYDIEVGQGCFYVIPLAWPLDTGLGVSARRIEDGSELGALDLDIAVSLGPPRFERFETTLASSYAPVTIELPRLGVARWRGKIPARPGKHRIELDDGRGVTLVVQASQPRSTPDPAFVRHVVAPESPSASPPKSRLPGRLVVTWLAPGPLQGRTVEIPLVGRGDWRDGPPARGIRALTNQGLIVDWSDLLDRECPWPMPEGGVVIQATVYTAQDVDVVDLWVEQCEAASDTRESAPCLRQDWTGGKYRAWSESLSLPICRSRVDTRRLVVAVGEEAPVRLGDDAGATFRIALPRDK